MDRRERSGDQAPALLSMLEGHQAGMWTALPGIIQSFKPEEMTCTVSSAIKVRAIDVAGVETWLTISLLVDCPVVFPTGGGLTLTFPLAAGDECLIVFSSRCIDNWWKFGGVREQAELRMHDLSDGFVIPGVHSIPRVLGSISTNSVQLRKDDGSAFYELKQDGSAVITAPAGLTINAPTTTINGNVQLNGSQVTTTNSTVNGTLNVPTGAINNNGKNVGSGHTHSGVTLGPDNSGAVT